MKKVSLLSFILLAILATSCYNNTDTKQWDNAHLDPGLPKNLIYDEMNGKEEIYSFFEKQNGSKRTSDVNYFSYGLHEKQNSSGSKFNNCRAYYSGSDTLLINIGINGPFGAYGLIIKYTNKKFYTEAYRYTDLIIVGETAPNQKIIYQKLSLNKLKYQVGDSLFGKIEFHSIDCDQLGDTILQYGHENFRAKIASASSN